ncbi:MAG: OsmC family protein [Candidatus Aenigmarchaeota archaeon]|nr:OsmC family protein [Candidatus Aenigmarchaeota archaeon]
MAIHEDDIKLNNVDTAKAGAFLEEVKADRNKAIKIKRVEGEWNFSGVQFTATLEHATGKTTVEADGPPIMGGYGLKPDPVQYCLFGLAACYAQTFASIAAEKGIELKQLKITVENNVNLSKSLGLGDEPIVENVKLLVTASGNGDLKEIESLAKERCPGVYCLTNPIKLEIESRFDVE